MYEVDSPPSLLNHRIIRFGWISTDPRNRNFPFGIIHTHILNTTTEMKSFTYRSNNWIVISPFRQDTHCNTSQYFQLKSWRKDLEYGICGNFIQEGTEILKLNLERRRVKTCIASFSIILPAIDRGDPGNQKYSQ